MSKQTTESTAAKTTTKTAAGVAAKTTTKAAAKSSSTTSTKTRSKSTAKTASKPATASTKTRAASTAKTTAKTAAKAPGKAKTSAKSRAKSTAKTAAAQTPAVEEVLEVTDEQLDAVDREDFQAQTTAETAESTAAPEAAALVDTAEPTDRSAAEPEAGESKSETETQRATTPTNEDDETPVLRLNNVSYSYVKGGKKVVDGLSHDFEAGKVISITGPSGAGKTTVLSLLSGLTAPTEGEILYQGKNLAQMDRYAFRSHDVGVIFQSFNLLPALTVEENIILSMEASGRSFDKPKHDVVVDLLAKVHLPEEYAKERILHLSGGEQQRVAIARALSYEPNIVLADEPTGNLDMATQDDIMAIFQSLAHTEGKCVIIVTHSPSVAKQSDEVFELKPLRRR